MIQKIGKISLSLSAHKSTHQIWSIFPINKNEVATLGIVPVYAFEFQPFGQ